MNSRLRERLGDARIAYYIFNHGLPDILDLGWTQDLGVLRPSARIVMDHLEELMKWHGGMLRSLVDHQNDPDRQTAQLWSSPTHAQWREQQRQHKAEAKQIFELGETLATASEDRKRRPENRTDRKQTALHEYCSGKSAKRYQDACGKRAPKFDGKDW